MRIFGKRTGTGPTGALPAYRAGPADTGRRVVITAGMDGDEYAGIEAAYRLIDVLGRRTLRGEVVILPLVNREGFFAGQSSNPQDGKFPKHIYPGNPEGTASERLIHGIATRYVSGAELWIDLHSGASDEELTPCILSYETGREVLDMRTLDAVGRTGATVVTREPRGTWPKVEGIARDGCGYIVCESGWGGRSDTADIRRHVAWTERILSGLGFLGSPPSKASVQKYYRSIREYPAHARGFWYPRLHAGDRVRKGTHCGVWRDLDRKKTRNVVARHDGIILWQLMSPAAERSDTLVAIASA